MLGLSHPPAIELAQKLLAVAPARRPRADARLLLRQRLDGQRDRPEDGVPVPQDPRRRAAHQVRVLGHELPRRHDRLGLGRRHRPLPHALPAAAVRRDPHGARRHRGPGADPRAARPRGRRADHGAARPGRRRHPAAPRRLPARGAGAVRQVRHHHDLRRGRDRLRAHRHDVRLRAGGRRARPDERGQGADGRLHAAGRDAGDRADLRGLPRQVRGVPHVLSRPHLHGQPAGLRGGDRHAAGLRGRGDARRAGAQDRAARRAARRARRAAGRGRRDPPPRDDGRHRADRLPAGGAHGPPGDAGGAGARRDRPAAGRHHRVDAAAVDQRGRAAPAGRDHRRGDRGRDGRRSPRAAACRPASSGVPSPRRRRSRACAHRTPDRTTCPGCPRRRSRAGCRRRGRRLRGRR